MPSLDGLVSGLSTSAMVAQLMQIEAAPQTRLKAKVTAEQSVLTVLQSVNTKLGALKTAAEALSGTSTTWQSAKATSSDSAVTVSAAAGAAAGSLTFDVTRLARNQISTITVPTPDTVITNSPTLSLQIGTAAPVDITVGGTGSAKDVADAINAKGIGVKAALVTNSSNETVLQLTSTKTGTANGFTVTAGLDPAVTMQTAVAAQNAQIAVGDPAAGGYTVTSDTNSFTNLMPGVTITASKVQAGVGVTVGSDAEAIAAKMQAFVDATNAALSELSKQGSIVVGAKKQAALAGDHSLRKMSQDILSATGNGATGFGSFKQVGVELSRDGTVKFDKEAFLAAYAADPAKAQTGASALADGLKTVTEGAQKNVTSLTQNHDNMIKSLNQQIDNWDVRLATRQAALQRTYSNLEVALGKLQSQSSWLSGQLGGLPTGSS